MTRPKIGLALGSGAARGFAHIGVLKILQQENIPIDYIAGSSMGSVIGVCFANGLDLAMMEKLVIHLKRKHWLDFTVPGLGFVVGEKMKELIRLLTHRKALEELDIPTAVVATDLSSGEPVIFRTGSIADAVRASSSIPGVFEPVVIDGRMLVDGGVIDRVPISVVREMGADLVIAVDVVPQASKVQVKNVLDVILQTLSIMEREILNKHIPAVDLMIHPDLADVSPSAFHHAEICIQRGEEAARVQVPQLREMLQRWQGALAVDANCD
jgi:NTE family protein